MRLIRPLLFAALLLCGCVSIPQVQRSPPSIAPAARQIAPTTNGAVKIGKPYQVFGVWYAPADDADYDATGLASWYGPGFHSLNTANGERYEMDGISAAHKTLPLPSYVEVHNLDNGRKLVVRINDRGPFVAGRIIDLSRAAAQLLGVDRPGVARVRVHRVYPDAAQIARLQPRIAAPIPVFAPEVASMVQSPPANPENIDAASLGNSNQFIQVAALSDPGRTSWLSGYLKAFGPVVTERSPGGLWRIRLGPYVNLASAQQTLAQVRAAGYGDARIVNTAPAR